MNDGNARVTIESAMARKRIAKLKDLAIRIGCSERSLRGWMKGEHAPSPYYIGQISNVLDIDARSLFIDSEDEDMKKLSRRDFVALVGVTGAAAISGNGEAWQRLESVLSSYTRIDDSSLEHLNTITQSYWQLRINFNSRELLQGINGHLDNVTQILQNSLLPKTRETLCSLAGEIASISGAISHQAEDHKNTRAYYRVALQAAHEGNNPALAATIYGRNSLSLNQQGQYKESLDTINQGIHLADKANPTIRAWLSLIKAETYAHLGDKYHTQKMFEQANIINEQLTEGEYSYWSGYDKGRLTSYQGTCYILLSEYEKASTIFKNALQLTSPHLVRRRGYILTQLAKIVIQNNDIEESCTYATEALYIANQVRSAYNFNKLQSVADSMQPYHLVPDVKHFLQQLEMIQQHA